jgi:ribose/xylose/arabinose/galactoside ABC-type transport system permease subunit
MALSGDNPVTRFPLELGDLWNAKLFGIPVTLFVLVGLFVVSYLVVHHTWMGRMLFAIGDNERAARFAGVPVQRLKLAIYAWSGLVAGLCGAAIVSKYGSAKANAESSLEMVAIACVVLGGIRITGGAGHVGGTVVGFITVSTLIAGLGSIDATWRDMVMGAILVTVAIANEAAARWASRLHLN